MRYRLVINVLLLLGFLVGATVALVVLVVARPAFTDGPYRDKLLVLMLFAGGVAGTGLMRGLLIWGGIDVDKRHD